MDGYSKVWIVRNEKGEWEGLICRDTKEEAVSGTMKMIGKRSWPKGWYCEEETPEQRTRREAGLGIDA